MNDKNSIELLKPEQLLTSPLNLKACLFNLVIYTSDARRAAYYNDITRMIAQQFPCRVIFINSSSNPNDSYLKMHLREEKDEIGRNCDIINIQVAGEYLDRVRFIILPYFVPDLPIYLLWGKDPLTEKAILPHLVKYATRLVFDSENCEDPQNFTKNLFKWLEANPIEITDMNWVRIRGWREIISQSFDSKERIAQINSAKTIKIVYNNRPSDLFYYTQTQAFYLQAWIAAMLKWKFEKYEKHNGHLFFYYKSDKQKSIQINLEGKNKENILSEEILEVEITDQSNFLYSLCRKNNNHVTVYCNTIDRCELPFSLGLANMWSGRKFMQEIFYKKMSQNYFRMLNLISHIPVEHL